MALALGLLGLLVQGAATGAAAPADSAAPVGTTLNGNPVWAHFSDPLANGGRDTTIHDELVRLIRDAPRGSRINATIYSLDMDYVAQALVDAEEDNGVEVRVVLDGKNQGRDNAAVRTIAALEGEVFCKNRKGGNSCISTSGTGVGDMHTKMVTFTQTRDPGGVLREDVSWFGSANLTEHSGPGMFNNAVTVYEDPALKQGLDGNFSDMLRRAAYEAGRPGPVPGAVGSNTDPQAPYDNNDYYDADRRRGYYVGESATAYASPEGRGQTDTIVTRLNDVKPNGTCELRIGMANVRSTRPELLDLVRTYRAAECRVWMVVGENKEHGINMAASVYSTLSDLGVKIHLRPEVHDKFFLVKGDFGGGADQYRVYTGSQNWTEDALNDNEEIFVKMALESDARRPLYDAYHAHFNDAYNGAINCERRSYADCSG